MARTGSGARGAHRHTRPDRSAASKIHGSAALAAGEPQITISGAQRPNPVPMSDAPDGGVLTFGAFDVVVFAAIVYLVTKLVRRVTGAPTERPKIA